MKRFHGTGVAMLEIPASDEKLTLMLYHNDTVEDHPGVHAIRQSFESGRSPRNIYVVIFYDGEMSSFVVKNLPSQKKLLRMQL